MRWAVPLLLLVAALACSRSTPPRKTPPDPPAARAKAPRSLRPQPKPGERVRQPELDGYCSEPQRAGAFYYHGGSPVIALARKDGCAPLFITECEAEGRCYPPRDQEPG